jgi:hypothetical protein
MLESVSILVDFEQHGTDDMVGVDKEGKAFCRAS